MAPPPALTALSSSEKDALVGVLMARLDALEARVSAMAAENAALRAENTVLKAENTALKAENATLRDKLNLPPKTPDNSSKPPSQGQKPNGAATAKSKGRAHAGAHRPQRQYGAAPVAEFLTAAYIFTELPPERRSTC